MPTLLLRVESRSQGSLAGALLQRPPLRARAALPPTAPAQGPWAGLGQALAPLPAPGGDKLAAVRGRRLRRVLLRRRPMAPAQQGQLRGRGRARRGR